MGVKVHALGLAASAIIVGAAIVACRPDGNVGYVEIKTVPVAPFAQTALYLDSGKLAPIKKGSVVLSRPVGTIELETDGFAGTLTKLCRIVVAKDRITSVTISVLDRPPHCQCQYTGSAAAHECVS